MSITVQDQISRLRKAHNAIGMIICDHDTLERTRAALTKQLKDLYRPAFEDQDRILIVLQKDFYTPSSRAGQILQLLQHIIQEIDISNYFISLISTNPNIESEALFVQQQISIDPVPLNLHPCIGQFERIDLDHEIFQGKLQISTDFADKLAAIDSHLQSKIVDDPVFCMMPWVGINIEPDSSVRPCCEFTRTDTLGNLKKNNLSEIWKSPDWKQLREQMLQGQAPRSCQSCYHKESLGRDSLRQYINREFAHRVPEIAVTHLGETGTLQLGYLDVRYNNLCNLTCRSCDSKQSSSWAQIHNQVYPNETIAHSLLTIDHGQDQIFDELTRHLSSVEKIYFAGGEPLIIENFYKVLNILDADNRHDVELIYNTNLTRLTLKDRNITDLWKKFKRVVVIASLDGMEQRGEYLRAGSNWSTILSNARTIKSQCPHVNFYISATTGLINALHVPDFHRSMIDQGLIAPEDFNLQLLYRPEWMSLRNAPSLLKQRVIERYNQHLDWLHPLDKLGRATSGFVSVIGFCQEDGIYDKENFWNKASNLDGFFRTHLYDCFPELRDLGL